MPIGMIYWMIVVVWVLFGIYTNRGLNDRAAIGGSLVELALFCLLGWRLFGPILQN